MRRTQATATCSGPSGASNGPDSEGHEHDGTVLGPLRILNVPKPEPVRRLTERDKRSLERNANVGYALCAAFLVSGLGASAAAPPVGLLLIAMAGVSCGVALTSSYLSRDPVDPNFRVVAKPKIPPASKVSAGEGLSVAAATAGNELLAVQVQEIGLSRAVLTALNRSQGAHVKKQTAWERKQMLAAGKYAGQLATAMLNEVKLRPGLREALDDPDTPDLSVSEEDAYAFQDPLIKKGLPAQFATTLAKLGFKRADQNELRAQIMASDLFALGSPLADAKLLASLRKVAADLRAFSKKAARDPLHTGQ